MFTQEITSMVTSQKWRVPTRSTRVSITQAITIRQRLKFASMVKETIPTTMRAKARFLHNSREMMESVSQAW